MGIVFRFGVSVPLEDLLGEGLVHRHLRPGYLSPQQLDRLPLPPGKNFTTREGFPIIWFMLSSVFVALITSRSCRGGGGGGRG